MGYLPAEGRRAGHVAAAGHGSPSPGAAAGRGSSGNGNGRCSCCGAVLWQERSEYLARAEYAERSGCSGRKVAAAAAASAAASAAPGAAAAAATTSIAAAKRGGGRPATGAAAPAAAAPAASATAAEPSQQDCWRPGAQGIAEAAVAHGCWHHARGRAWTRRRISHARRRLDTRRCDHQGAEVTSI